MKTFQSLPLLAIFLVVFILAGSGKFGALASTLPAASLPVDQNTKLYLPLQSKQEAGMIINHTTTDLSKIPSNYIEKAKQMLRLSYGHTSHGSQLVTGMGYLDSNSLYSFNTDGSITAGVLSLEDYTPSGDLGNPDLWSWASRTRTYLDGSGQDRNVVMWSWCGQVSGQSDQVLSQNYLSLMPALERDYPDVKFIYMTGHLDGSGPDGTLYQRNNQIRAFVQQNHKVLFDFADIESYDPDGNYYPNADDSCPWCQQYCNSHPGYCTSFINDSSCAHSHPLNCYIKGKAFWWMMARLAGWQGPQN